MSPARRAPRALLGAAVLAAGALVAVGACSHVEDAAGVVEAPFQIGHNLVKTTLSGGLTRKSTLSMNDEYYLGETITARVLARYGVAPLPPEHPTARYLRDVGTVVAVAATELWDPAEDRPYPLKGYHFLLVDSPAVNALGIPGGFVVVTTGAVRAARTEDELAAVLAHEIAHVQKGHAVGKLEDARKQERLQDDLLKGTKGTWAKAFYGKAVELTTDIVYDKPLEQPQEFQADAFAARILRAAGYDPAALGAYLSRVPAAADGSVFGRHPPTAERLRQLSAMKLEAAAAPAVRTDRFAAATGALERGT